MAKAADKRQQPLTLSPVRDEVAWLGSRGWQLAGIAVTDHNNNTYNVTAKRMPTATLMGWFANDATRLQALLENFRQERRKIPQPKEPDQAKLVTASDAAQFFRAGEKLQPFLLMVEGQDLLTPFQARAAYRAGFRAAAFTITHPTEKPITVALVLNEAAGGAAWFLPSRDLPRVRALTDNYEPAPKAPPPAKRGRRREVEATDELGNG